VDAIAECRQRRCELGGRGGVHDARISALCSKAEHGARAAHASA
jgi:hypothetical protein